MRKVYIAVPLGAAVALTAAGCSGEENYIYVDKDWPSVRIERAADAGTSSLALRFVPDEGSAGFTYAVGTDADREAFLAGRLPQAVRAEGGGPVTATAEGLEPGTVYTVFAQAFDAALTPGPLAEARMATDDDIGLAHPLDFAVNYVSSYSAAVRLNPDNYYWRFSYALGTAADRKAFADGTLEGTESCELLFACTLSFFDLEPDTEYILFVRAYNRAGEDAGVTEIPLETAAAGAVPDAELTVDRLDIYCGSYTFKPNPLCGKLVVLVCRKGTYDGMFHNEYGRNGDIAGALLDLAAQPYEPPTVTSEGEPARFVLYTPDLKFEDELEAWALAFDTSGEPYAVRRFGGLKTPAPDPDAGTAAATVEISGITPWSYDYAVSANARTLLVYSKALPAEEFEYMLSSMTEHEIMQHIYENMEPMLTYTPAGPMSGTLYGMPGRYYFVACPANANGPGEGWGELFYTELVLPEAEQ